MGFEAGKTNVRAYVAHLRTSTARGQAPAKRSKRTLAISRWLLTREREVLDQEEQTQLDQLLSTSQDVLESASVASLLEPFHLRLLADVGSAHYQANYFKPMKREMVVSEMERIAQATVMGS